MQKLAEAINDYGEAKDLGDPEFFRKAACDWSTYSLRTFRGKLLDRALSISVGMVEFLNEMETMNKEPT